MVTNKHCLFLTNRNLTLLHSKVVTEMVLKASENPQWVRFFVIIFRPQFMANHRICLKFSHRSSALCLSLSLRYDSILCACHVLIFEALKVSNIRFALDCAIQGWQPSPCSIALVVRLWEKVWLWMWCPYVERPSINSAVYSCWSRADPKFDDPLCLYSVHFSIPTISVINYRPVLDLWHPKILLFVVHPADPNLYLWLNRAADHQHT